MTTIERLEAEAFQPREDLFYIDVNKTEEFYKKVAFKSNHILVGPKGIGKSLSVAHVAKKINCSIVTFDCSEDIRRTHLLGTFVIRGNETPFILGPLPTAIEVANETGFCILVLEEINGLSPTMQKVLNPLTDFRKRIELPEIKKVFELVPNA